MTDEALEALKKHVEALEKEQGIQCLPPPRDFVSCRWCNSKGCAACYKRREQRKKELDEEYKRQFPNGPQPFFTARLDNPEEMEQAKRVVGREALEKAFGPDGGGMEEVLTNAEREMAKRKTE